MINVLNPLHTVSALVDLLHGHILLKSLFLFAGTMLTHFAAMEVVAGN
jgi:hypothetical protein